MQPLTLTFSTDTVHPRDRFDFWHSVACKSYVEHECDPNERQRFEGHVDIAPLAHTSLSTYSNTPARIWRTPRQVARAHSDDLYVCLQTHGTCTVSQDGRDASLQPGDFCLADTSGEYAFTYPVDSSQLILKIERARLKARLPHFRSLMAVPVRNSEPTGALAFEFIGMLPRYRDAITGVAELRIADQAVDLAALALSTLTEASGLKLSSTSASALLRLRRAVEARPRPAWNALCRRGGGSRHERALCQSSAFARRNFTRAIPPASAAGEVPGRVARPRPVASLDQRDRVRLGLLRRIAFHAIVQSSVRDGATGLSAGGVISMQLDEHKARIILDMSHAAWSRGDVEGVLVNYVDDLTYYCNTGGPDGGALLISGKQALRDMLRPIADVAESVSVSEYFRYEDGVGRAKIECYIRHKTTRHVLVGSYRQIVTYRGDKIERMEEFHDAAKMIAFWQMISGDAAIEKALLAELE